MQVGQHSRVWASGSTIAPTNYKNKMSRHVIKSCEMDFQRIGERENYGLLDVKQSQLWTCVTAAIAFMIGFRTNKADRY